MIFYPSSSNTGLYHGTSAAYLDEILSKGLTPRGKRQGNWSDYPSCSEMVYLTTAYPLYFASSATKQGDRLAVIEVDSDSLDEDLCYPDEDVIAQSFHQQLGMSLKVAQAEVLRDIESYQHYWKSSLDTMGTVAYRGTVKAKRVALIDTSKMEQSLLLSMLDPTITPINYAIRGGFYNRFVKWVFGEGALPHLDDQHMMLEVLTNPEQRLRVAQTIERLEKIAEERAGIEVLSV